MIGTGFQAGDPREIRTPDTLIRSQVLYPAELLGRIWQGQRDSNPQPTVLETVALSIALCPYLFDGSHHPCDLYIITNLFGNCKGFLQIFLKKDFGAKFRDLRKRLNGSREGNGVVRCVIKAPHGHTVFFQTEIPLNFLNFAPSPISASYPRR